MGSWEALEAEIVTCRRCPRLVAWREGVAQAKRRAYSQETYWGRPVPGFGDRAGRLLIVGLAPGAHGANRTGRMFTGDSAGDFLCAALYRAGFANQPHSEHRQDGLVMRDAFVTAVCRCAPPANKPNPEELAACRPYLEREIALLERLQVIVALGRIAFDVITALYGVGPLAFGHAALYPLGPGRPYLIGSYHPSRQNTQTGRLTINMFDQVWAKALDLLKRT